MRQIFIVALLLISCTAEVRLKSLEKEIKNEILENPNSVLSIRIDRLYIQEYTDYLILTPYVQTIAEMEEIHKVNLSNVSDAIQHYDDFNTIILLKGKESTGYFNLSRSYEILNKPRILHKSNQPLKIKKP